MNEGTWETEVVILLFCFFSHKHKLTFLSGSWLMLFSAKLCLTLCEPMDCSSPGSSGISQARILEWVVISFLQGIIPTQGLIACLLH